MHFSALLSPLAARIPAACPDRRCLLLLGIFALLLTTARPASALGTAVPYTGQLLSGTAALNGQYDFQFTLYNAATGGSTVGSTLSVSSLTVANGVFYVELDFGSVYTGTNLYLQTAYRKTGTSTYTTQSTRKLFSTSGLTDYAALSGSTTSLQGFFVSARAPTDGQVLTWIASGNKWLPQSPLVPPAYTAGTGLTLSGTQFSVAAGGITNSLLATNSVSNAKIATNAVSNSKLADGSVSGSKLSLPLTASVSSDSDLFTITNTGNGRAIVGNSSNSTAVKGVGYNGVYGQGMHYGVQASGTNYGVYAVSSGSSGIGVYGSSANSYGIKGIYGAASGVTGYGTSAVLGDTDTGNGVIGLSSTSGGYGVEGIGDASGLYGEGNYGVYGYGSQYGVYGSGSNSGVYGYNNLNLSYGILGGPGMEGNANGVIGESEVMASEGILAIDKAETSYALYAIGDSNQTGNYAGVFDGKVAVNGNLVVTGTLTKSGGSFKIDDPIDPAHKFLSHSFVESPDMKNIYDGTVTLGADGTALVTLPDWFEALNQDFRYQLTAIGAPGPNLYIAKEIDGNQFAIAGGQPGAKVSWQVTGTRHDAWANAHRIPVEEDKPADEQGTYLHPKEFGRPASQGIDFRREQGLPRHLPNPPIAAQAAQP